MAPSILHGGHRLVKEQPHGLYFHPACHRLANRPGRWHGYVRSRQLFQRGHTEGNPQGQAAVADINARISELGAQSALYQGQQQVGALTLNAGRLKSSQRAAMAANGIAWAWAALPRSKPRPTS